MILPISFLGKRILVTGAGRGLGKEIVKALVKQEATVFALSKTPETLEALKNELPQVNTICTDLQDWKRTKELIKNIGTIHLLVNNAGVNIGGPFMGITPENFDRTMHTNVRSSILVSQVIAADMIQRDEGGSIVIISSVAQKRPSLNQSLYCTSKAALGMLTRNMALELGPSNIRVNSVNPSLFPSDMSKAAVDNPTGRFVTGVMAATPLRRMVLTEEIVNVVLFLLSDLSPMISGQSISVCGGLT